MPSSRKESISAVFLSTGAHLFGVVLLIAMLRHWRAAAPPLHLPGTVQGSHLLLTYSRGGPAELPQSRALQRTAAKRVPNKVSVPTPLPSPPVGTSAPMSEPGPGTSGESGLGDENVRVALPQVHPRPQPDLSALPPGTAGDVIVDVVIDEAGKVVTTTLVKGLGSSIDAKVMQTLRGWTFTPATRNGQNIASEQEILVHYERG